MTYTLHYTLPEAVLQEIEAVVALRRPKDTMYRKRLEALLLYAKQNNLLRDVQMDLAIRLAWAAREWSKSRPLKTSWRGYSLGATLVTDSWLYDAYNTKPLRDTDAEEKGYPKVRICAEQQAIFFANEADDVDIRLIILVGVHHDDGDGHMPKPCGACLRYFTALPHHREIEMVLINTNTGEKALHTVGEIIDNAELPTVECTCCTPSIDADIAVVNKYPHLAS